MLDQRLLLMMEEVRRFSTSSIRPLLKQVLQVLETECDDSLTPEVCKGLTTEEEEEEAVPSGGHTSGDEQGHPHTSSGGLAVLTGYPRYPLYLRLADSLTYWMLTGKCPVLDLPTMWMLNEQASLDERQQALESIGSRLVGAYSLWEHWSVDERKHTLLTTIKALGLRGVLDLLGVRETVGSSSILPPSRRLLLGRFEMPHSPRAKLTVGARALAKHCHRDDSLNWWGQCTGTEEEKNQHARAVVDRIMHEATWINIHSLPHELKIVEMRTIEGYGARWLHDGSEFRGFLEPQMEEGHTLGWRH